MQRDVGSHVDEAIRHLLQSGKTAEDIHKALSRQTVDLVFTAHPTQAMRDSVRTKYDALYRSLKARHGMQLSDIDRIELKKSMYASIQAAWCAASSLPCRLDCCSGLRWGLKRLDPLG